METKKFCLTEKQMPTQWYNIVADMPNKPLPPLHPGTKKPVTKEQMSAIFAEELIDQEMSTERYIDIPEEVIRRRYATGMRNMVALYAPLRDYWVIYDNSSADAEIRIIATGENDTTKHIENPLAYQQFMSYERN